MLIRRPQRPPVRSGRTELGPYASSRSSFPTSRRPSSSAGQVVQVPWSQPAVKLVGGGRQPLTPKGTLVLTRGQQRVPVSPPRPLWAAGHGARRRDPGEAGRPQPAVRDLEPPQLRRSNDLRNRFVSPHRPHGTPQVPGPWTCPAQTMWGRSTSRASKKPRLTSSSSPSKRRSSCSIETTWS